jgi:hypothetical protein
MEAELLCSSDSADKVSIFYTDTLVAIFARLVLVFRVHINHLVAQFSWHRFFVIFYVLLVDYSHKAGKYTDLAYVNQ